jgi:UDP-N-acetyl-D-mannosaminuronic acid dehydrogenase
MPAYAVDLLAAELGGELAGRRVLILGVTYRGAVKETAFSGAFALRRELERRGAAPVAADPLFTPEELAELGFATWDGTDVDGVILQADHPDYAELRPEDVPGARALIDGRGVLEASPWTAAGIPVRRIGHG